MERRWTLFGAPLALAALLASGAIAASGPVPPRTEDAPQPAALPELSRLTDGADAPALEPGPAADEPAATVAGDVLAAFREDERVPVIVRLREQANVNAVAARARANSPGAGKDARATAVVDALQRTADSTQPGVRGLLRAEEAAGRARDIRSYWIFNGLAATVSRSTLERLAQRPDVESVTLDEEIALPETTSEPRLPTWGLEKVAAPRTWGEYGYTGKGVVVGVMDSGVDGGHPALASRWRGRTGDTSSSWYAATGENYAEPGDGHGHGTHVTGTIVGGAPGDIVGVAPDAQWIAAKIFRDSGSTSSSIIHDGFQWMLAPGGDPTKAPDVVNNSWGSSDSLSTEFLEDVRAWVAAGIFPAFANGNDGPGTGTVGSPGSFPESFGVGATDINDQIASFSSRGPVVWEGVRYVKPQLSAPGAQIYSSWPRQLGEGDYNTISGTSMATPHLTGVVALLLSAQPDLTVDATREVLLSSARTEPHMGKLPNDNYGAGIADAYAAITRARFSGTLTGTITGPDGPIAARVAIPELELETTSDPTTGFFELRVREGTWTLEADAYGFVGEAAEVTIAAGGSATQDFSLAAAAVHTLSGTVSSGGEPVAGARVRVAGTPLDPAYTGADGSYSLEVAAGTYEVGADATGYERASRQVELTGDTSVSFELERLGGAVEPDWAEYQNNEARTGLSAEELAAGALTQSWSVDLSGQIAFASPVIADDRVYIGFDGGRLNALDLDSGETVWTFTTGASFRSTPAVAGGKLYVGGGDSGRFHALDAATGEPLWSYETGDRLTYAAPAVVDGTVYFGTGWGTDNGGWVYALDAATGALRWKHFVGPQIYFAPAVGGGRVYAASYDAQRLAALDAATGEELWSLSRSGDSFAAMPAYDGERLYVATNNFDTGAGSVLAVDAATGDLLWEAEGHGDGAGNAPVVFGDLVIAGSNANNWVVAYDRETGERAWVHAVGAAVSNSQLAADGVLVGGSQQDHRVWALDAYSGEQLWEDSVSDNVLSAPALADGRLVVADRSGVVRAYEAPGTVAGTVTGPGGAPLDAEVRVPETGDSVRTDPATGAYELPHRPGEYVVEAYAYGHLVSTATVAIRSGQRTTRDFELAPAANGSLRGEVRDAGGAPLAGASVALEGTPLEPATSGADGSFAFPSVAAGTYELTATLDGYVAFAADVTVAAGEETVVPVTLLRYEIAVTGDHEGAITRSLEAKGYRVEATTIAAIADRPGDYRLIVANGSRDDPGAEVFRRFVENADAAEVSVIFLDTWGISYGSLLHLSTYTGDPPTTGSGYNDGEVSFVSRVAHPLTEGLELGERVEALARETEYAWFAGYGGRSVADVYIGDVGRTVGSAIGYEPRSLGSVHVLLGLHAASPWTGPTMGWSTAAGRVFDNAVRYALDASFGAVAGTVTGTGGEPLAATATIVETGDSATAAADGTYRLLVPAGSYTLRFERVGYTPHEVAVTVADGDTTTVDAVLASSGLGAITGIVTSAADDAPVAGAQVEVLESGLAPVTTGADGRFTVDGVPGGTYDVEVGAAGFGTQLVEDVVVADGAATDIAVELRPALRVAVLGDYNNTITTFLNENEVTATATGWEAIDDLDAYDLLVLNDPADPGEEEFLANLDALDAAGKSAIFIEGAFSSDGGVRLLRKYFGDPAERDFVSSDGDPFYEPTASGHPLFAGFQDGERVQVLAGDEWGAYWTGYSGIELARFGTNELGVLGGGAAYEPRTPTSVRLLLAGLGASSIANPANGWSDDGDRIFLNAIRWAAAPGLATLSGRVADAANEPVAGATVRIAETGLETTTGPDGSYELAHPAGAYTAEVSAFGYVAQSLPVTLTANAETQLVVELALADVGRIAGTITSAGDLSPNADPGEPLAGADVKLLGTPRATTTAENGAYALENVEPGTYTLEITAADHVRTLVEDVVVAAGQVTSKDVRLRASPSVGVIDDCQQTSGCVDKLQAYLDEWGYVAEEIGWGDTERLAELDLVVANLGDFPRLDPGAAGLAAFQDAANRAHVPVIWLEQFQRGSIRHLSFYEGDPASVGEDRSEGPVVAEILADHPLTAGFEVGERVPLIEEDGEHTWFNDFSGTTVASLHNEDGLMGSTLAYRGRTASSVDVLFSSFAASFYTWPPAEGEPAELLTPQALRLFQNALNYALDAPALAGEARGTVRSSVGGPIASTVKVLETGKTFAGRTGDGTFFVPLQPGTWTLAVSAFGHGTVERSVTVAAGDVRQLDVVLPADASGSVAGSVTDEAGAPLEAASVALEGTPLATETGADGRYRLDNVPVGDYELVVRKAGYGVERRIVTVGADATTTVDVRLAVSRVIAVAGDSLTRLSDFLTANGYEVVPWSWSEIDAHVGDLADVGLVILNGVGTQPTSAELSEFLDAAAAAGKSVIFAGQNGNGSIRTLRTTYGDPTTVTHSFAQREIYYRPAVEHPIFAGFPVGEPIELMRNPTGGTSNQQYEFFLGYTGTTIAKLGAPAKGGDLGDGVGFRFTSPTSVHVLLASLGASSFGWPGERWSENAERIYLNAVEWALDAAQGQVFGTVSSEGEPVAGALVTAVEAELSTRTGTDGSYRLGVPNGTHTIRVTAVGYEPFEQSVEVAEDARVQLDVALTPIERGAIAGTVVDESSGAPLAGAEVTLSGAGTGATVTDAAGAFAFDGLLPGEYSVDVLLTGYLPQTVPATVTGGETTTLAIELQGNDVAVLGDVDGVLVGFLREHDVAAEERTWAELAGAAGRYDVVVVNGGEPTAAEFEAAVDAADAAGTSVIFTGTWGVLNGGLHLLAQHRPEEVEIGGQGYGDGAVTLTGFDGAHPLFAGLTAPAAPLAPDSQYSWLDSYVGPYLARLAVEEPGDLGVSVAYDYRSAEGLHLLLSAGAVSDFVGPGYGWTAAGERLFLNAVSWAREAEQAAPAAPTLATGAAPVVPASPIELTGTAEFRSTVTLLRDGAPVGTAEPARDGSFAVEAALVEGPNVFTAVARNYGGDSPASAPVTVTLDTTGPALSWTPADGTGFFDPSLVVGGTVTDAHAGVAEVLVNGSAASLTPDGTFAADVDLVEGENTLVVTARDRVGNETTETRTVAYFDYGTAWQVTGEKGRGSLIAFLRLTDPAGRSLQVDSVTAELVDEEGAVQVSRAMVLEDERYKAELGKPPAGTYTLRGIVVVDGFTVRTTGPTFVRAGEPAAAGSG